MSENRRNASDVFASGASLTTLAVEVSDEMADSYSNGKAPAFQFYPNDFLSDANVISQSMQERGVYITLLCVCWQQGSLPSDVAPLARFCGLPLQTFRKLWPAVQLCFQVSANGERLVHARLDRERKKQREFRKAQSDKGKLGGRPRKLELLPSKATAFEPESQPKTEKSSSSSSSSSSSLKERAHVRASDEDALSQRAGLFVRETYPALYEKHRKGAKYIGKPNLDYLEAMELCRTWDDERLRENRAGVSHDGP